MQLMRLIALFLFELDLSHQILVELSQIRKTNEEMLYLRPDSKSQVTIEYSDDHTPLKIFNCNFYSA